MTYYLLRGAAAPWGDYGRILTHGMSAHRQRVGGIIQLERSGPFIPPITFPAADVVATDVLRAAVETSGLTGASFQRVEKAHIVRINWERWDRTQPMPPHVPPSAAPEDYILGEPHDPTTSAQLGDLWELVVVTEGAGRRDRGARRGGSVTSITLPRNGMPDFFRVKGPRYVLVSDAAREWLREQAAEWVAFEECRVSYT